MSPWQTMTNHDTDKHKPWPRLSWHKKGWTKVTSDKYSPDMSPHCEPWTSGCTRNSRRKDGWQDDGNSRERLWRLALTWPWPPGAVRERKVGRSFYYQLHSHLVVDWLLSSSASESSPLSNLFWRQTYRKLAWLVWNSLLEAFTILRPFICENSSIKETVISENNLTDEWFPSETRWGSLE